MRKNGINRKLTPIEGGICAVEGFRANAVYCGFGDFVFQENGKEDLALIVADRPCPTACVYSTSAIKGAPIAVTKKHMRRGFGQEILINSGVANVFIEDGQKLAELACREIGKYINVDAQDVVIASTGRTDGTISLKQFADNMPNLIEGLSADKEHSLLAARAITTTDKTVKEFSYSFDLGAFSCKIGGILKGSSHVSPNMATTLLFLTTNVNISPEMLQKALLSEVRETLNLLDIDGQASPNDMVCIMANGKGGNYRISCMDTEYKKFTYILREVLTQVCKMLIEKETESGKIVSCHVRGGKSKQVSRAVARSVVGCIGLKKGLANGRLDLESVICAISNAEVEVDLSQAEITFSSEKERTVVFESGMPLSFSKEMAKRIVQEMEREIEIDLRMGNYSSTAFGSDLCEGKP